MSHVWPGGDCMRETLVLGGLVLESTCPGGGGECPDTASILYVLSKDFTCFC